MLGLRTYKDKKPSSVYLSAKRAHIANLVILACIYSNIDSVGLKVRGVFDYRFLGAVVNPPKH